MAAPIGGYLGSEVGWLGVRGVVRWAALAAVIVRSDLTSVQESEVLRCATAPTELAACRRHCSSPANSRTLRSGLHSRPAGSAAIEMGRDSDIISGRLLLGRIGGESAYLAYFMLQRNHISAGRDNALALRHTSVSFRQVRPMRWSAAGRPRMASPSSEKR